MVIEKNSYLKGLEQNKEYRIKQDKIKTKKTEEDAENKKFMQAYATLVDRLAENVEHAIDERITKNQYIGNDIEKIRFEVEYEIDAKLVKSLEEVHPSRKTGGHYVINYPSLIKAVVDIVKSKYDAVGWKVNVINAKKKGGVIYLDIT